MKIKIYSKGRIDNDVYDEWSDVEDHITDYSVIGNLFVIKKDSAWVGIYNLEEFKKIVIE